MIRRAEVTDDGLETMTRAVVAEWAPRRVILFDSRARGDHRPDSDYDLMIVIDAPGSVGDCETAIRTRLSAVDRPVDVSVATTSGPIVSSSETRRTGFDRRRRSCATESNVRSARDAPCHALVAELVSKSNRADRFAMK